MRLNTPISSKFAGVVDGLKADIVDQILGTAERKRSRPTSSLDVKVDRLKQTRPPSRSQQQQQQKKKNQNSGERKKTYPRTTTRRGGGGIPPKFDFSDLEGMSEEQLRMALAADPELAAAAAAAADNANVGAKRKKTKNPYYRNKDGHVKSIHDYPAHLQSMMEEGIPVKQWFILLILLGAGLYQLRKSMSGPTLEKSLKKTPLPKKASRKVGNKKGSKKISSSPLKQGDVLRSEEKPAPPLLEEELAALVNGKEELAAPVTDATQAKAAKKKRKPTKQMVQPEQTTKDESRQSSDGSSAAGLVVDPSEPLDHVRDEPESVEWQTVGKGSAAETPHKKNGSKVQHEPPLKNDVIREAPNATTVADVSKEEAEAVVKPTRKKKKKNKVVNASTLANATAPEVVSTQDDEALALKLQQQEEKLAAADAHSLSEDVWAAVAPKKARRKSQTETETNGA
jgi:hypothetical protein